MSIHDMLAKLRRNRQLITEQVDVLNDVLIKSNNVLLQIESECSKDQQDLSSLKPYSYGKDTEYALTKAIELHQDVLKSEQQNDEVVGSDLGFADYLQQNCQNLSYLSSNVRKLLVVGEIISNITSQTQQEGDSENGE